MIANEHSIQIRMQSSLAGGLHRVESAEGLSDGQFGGYVRAGVVEFETGFGTYRATCQIVGEGPCTVSIMHGVVHVVKLEI